MEEDYIRLRCMAVVLILCAAPGAAMAYIDPGNGAYMVQALFALVGAALFYLRHPIRSIKALWQSITGRTQSADPLPPPSVTKLGESDQS